MGHWMWWSVAYIVTGDREMCCISMEAIIVAYITRCGVNEGEIRTSQEMLTEERGHNWCQPDKYMYSYHLFPYNLVNLFQWSYKNTDPMHVNHTSWGTKRCLYLTRTHTFHRRFFGDNVGHSNRFFFIAVDEVIGSWQWMLGLKGVKDQ